MKKTLLEKLQDAIGIITAYDGEYVVWADPVNPEMTRATYDLRDVIPMLKDKKVTLALLQECLPVLEKPRRARASLKEAAEEE